MPLGPLLRTTEVSASTSEVIADLIVVLWFAGAVVMSQSKRFARLAGLAWSGSLLGVGATACFFAAIVGTSIWMAFFPSPEDLAGPGGTGFRISALMAACMFSVPLATCVVLFAGLLRQQKKLFHQEEKS